MGTLSGDLTLSATTAPGGYSFCVYFSPTAKYGEYLGGFGVRSTRVPDFLVAVGQPDRLPRWDQPLLLPVRATHLDGRPVVGAQVSVSCGGAEYRWAPEELEWRWGEPYMFEHRYGLGLYYPGRNAWLSPPGHVGGTTDADGLARVAWTPRSAHERPWRSAHVVVNAQVNSDQGQSAGGSALFKIGQDAFTLGVRPDRRLFGAGGTARLEINAWDSLDHPAACTATVTVYRSALRAPGYSPPLDTGGAEGSPGAHGLDHWMRGEAVWTGTAQRGADAASTTLDIPALGEGRYEVEVSSPNPWSEPTHEGAVTATTTFWTVGGEAGNALYRELHVLPEAETVRPGSTLRLLVIAPAEHGHLLVTVAGERLISWRSFALTRRSSVVEMPVTEAWSPSARLLTTFVGGGVTSSTQIELEAPSDRRRLLVTLTPDRADYAPGQKGVLRVSTTTTDGQPVSARVCLAIGEDELWRVQRWNLDEDRRDRLGTTRRSDAVSSESALLAGDQRLYRWSGRSLQATTTLPSEEAFVYGVPTLEVGGSGGHGPPQIGFAPLSNAGSKPLLWQPSLQTDADGRASVELPFPEHVGGWRAVARAITAEGQVGSAAILLRTGP